MNDSIKNAPADAERRLLLQATVTAGAIARVATAVPFLGSMAPSQRALSESAPVDVDISAIAPGAMSLSPGAANQSGWCTGQRQ